MQKSEKLYALASLAMSLSLLLNGCSSISSVSDNASGREYIEDNIVYIEPDPVGLESEMSGNSLLKEVSKAAFEIANQQRAAAGLGNLTWNSGLEQACAVRAVEASQSFSHTRPDGSDWWTVNSNLMYGENLAKGYESAEAAVQAWMNSPTHKANILDTEFTSGAIAIHIGSNGQWFWAQEFGY